MAVVVDIDIEAGNLDEFDSIAPYGTSYVQAYANAALGQTSYGVRVQPLSGGTICAFATYAIDFLPSAEEAAKIRYPG